MIWPIQEGTNLTQKEVTTLEEVRFSFDNLHRNNVQSLFGSQSCILNNSHVLTISCHSLVRSFDASCWPTTCGGKKVKWPSIFKLTQQHINNWEARKLLFQCTVFLAINVPPPRYGRIYSIFSDDKKFNVIIGNFLGCSCVYFATMLVGFWGGYGVYVQCKHVYHFLNMITLNCCNPTLRQVWGWDSHSQKWELGVLWDSRNFRAQLQGSKHLALRFFSYFWKVLEV
jgi:hypothetical protein